MPSNGRPPDAPTDGRGGSPIYACLYAYLYAWARLR
jgi:hypothetical protein